MKKTTEENACEMANLAAKIRNWTSCGARRFMRICCPILRATSSSLIWTTEIYTRLCLGKTVKYLLIQTTIVSMKFNSERRDAVGAIGQ